MIKLKKLQKIKKGYQDKVASIHSSEMDPDMKAYYLNDVEYAIYCIDDQIDFEKKMLSFKFTLYGFVAFTIGLIVWALLSLNN